MVIFGGLETSKIKSSNDIFTLDVNSMTWQREETSGCTIPKKESRTAALMGDSINENGKVRDQ